jgi:hypothetical protein
MTDKLAASCPVRSMSFELRSSNPESSAILYWIVAITGSRLFPGCLDDVRGVRLHKQS